MWTKEKNQDKTYCIGFWSLAGNKKRSAKHYSHTLAITLKMLNNQNLVFIHNDAEMLCEIQQLAKQYNISLHGIEIPVEQLPAHPRAMDILERTKEYGDIHDIENMNLKKEKGLVHYTRDYQGYGAETYLKMLTIWLSKVLLTQRVCQLNPFDSKNFAWVDASISRFNDKRDYWWFTDIPDKEHSISCYRGKLKKNGNRLFLNASYLSGSSYAWNKLAKIYTEQLELVSSEAYPNDEETILDACHTAQPELFNTLNPARDSFLKKYSLSYKIIKRIYRKRLHALSAKKTTLSLNEG